MNKINIQSYQRDEIEQRIQDLEERGFRVTWGPKYIQKSYRQAYRDRDNHAKVNAGIDGLWRCQLEARP